MDARSPAAHIPGYSLAHIKRIIAGGNVAAMAVGLWTIFVPTYFYTPALLLCILLPLWGLALDMRMRGTLGFEDRRSRRSPLSLATILVLPALALAIRAGIDLNFESYAPLIAKAVLAATAILALFWCLDRQLKGDLNQSATIAIFALAYCYGALAFADVVLDPSRALEKQTVIYQKRIHVSGGPKGSSVWYQVKVDPGASPAGADWINTQPGLWNSLRRGDGVCVRVGRGLLASRWYAVGHCED
jgi:hypothetical protein